MDTVCERCHHLQLKAKVVVPDNYSIIQYQETLEHFPAGSSRIIKEAADTYSSKTPSGRNVQSIEVFLVPICAFKQNNEIIMKGNCPKFQLRTKTPEVRTVVYGRYFSSEEITEIDLNRSKINETALLEA